MNLSNRERNLTFAVLLISSIGTSLLQTALTTALPSIMKDFGVTASTAQWLTSIYSLAMGVMVPATAYLMKRFPTKKLFLWAVLLFAAGTVLSMTALVFPVMLSGRIIQAVGNGMVLPMTQVVVLTIYPEEQRGSVMGIYGGWGCSGSRAYHCGRHYRYMELESYFCNCIGDCSGGYSDGAEIYENGKQTGEGVL